MLSASTSRTVISIWSDNVFCFKSNTAVKSDCVTSPIAEIVLVIPFSCVIILMLILLPAVNLSCFSDN